MPGDDEEGEGPPGVSAAGWWVPGSCLCVCEIECERGAGDALDTGVVLHLCWSLEELFLSGPEPGDRGSSWASRLSSFPPLLASRKCLFLPLCRMPKCGMCSHTGRGLAMLWGQRGVPEGSWGQPRVEGLWAYSPCPCWPSWGGRRGQVCWVPPTLQFGCPSSSLELGRSPLPAPE